MDWKNTSQVRDVMGLIFVLAQKMFCIPCSNSLSIHSVGWVGCVRDHEIMGLLRNVFHSSLPALPIPPFYQKCWVDLFLRSRRSMQVWEYFDTKTEFFMTHKVFVEVDCMIFHMCEGGPSCQTAHSPSKSFRSHPWNSSTKTTVEAPRHFGCRTSYQKGTVVERNNIGLGYVSILWPSAWTLRHFLQECLFDSRH